MLIEFAVSNFRSIKEEARLSLVAGRDMKYGDSNTFVQTLGDGGQPIRLLRSAALYGANASGKTNLLLGLKAMHEIVLGSSGNLATLPVTPFRFDPAYHNQPSSFEVIFVMDAVRYQYGFSATREQVIDEWLYAWPSGRMQTWFERSRGPTPGTSKWTLGGKLTGDRQVWRRATRPQALFLSTAVGLNSIQLLPIFNWFRERLRVIVGYHDVSPKFSMDYCSKLRQTDIVDFLRTADLAVTDIRIVERAVRYCSYSRRTTTRYWMENSFGATKSGSADATSALRRRSSRSATSGQFVVKRTCREHTWPADLEQFLTYRDCGVSHPIRADRWQAVNHAGAPAFDGEGRRESPTIGCS